MLIVFFFLRERGFWFVIYTFCKSSHIFFYFVIRAGNNLNIFLCLLETRLNWKVSRDLKYFFTKKKKNNIIENVQVFKKN